MDATDPTQPVTETLPKPGFAEEALPELDAVYRFALRLAAGSVHEAEDLVQETFLRAYRAWESYERGTNCRSWLFTICRNVFLRGREREARRREQPMSGFDVEIESITARAFFGEEADTDPERQFFDSFVDSGVLAAVDALPDDFREVVVLSDLQGLRYAEIAAVLGVPLGTVKSRLFRGRRLLQQALASYAREMGLLPQASPAAPEAAS